MKPVSLSVLFLLFLLFSSSVTRKEEKNPLTITKTYIFENIPSGSGLSISNNLVFICSDDSPFLFRLNQDLELEKELAIFPDLKELFRIPKKDKPDLEAMAEMTKDGQSFLYIFGSGSTTEKRSLCLKVPLNMPGKYSVHLIEGMYQHIKTNCQIKDSSFNIEGAAFHNDTLLLLNRGSNTVISVPHNSFAKYLNKEISAEEIPLSYTNVKLPEVNGQIPGFSGADMMNDNLIFTASVELTEDWVSDGEIIGSYLGIISSTDIVKREVEAILPFRDRSGRFLPDKVESVFYSGTDDNGNHNLLSVTDNDDGTSKIMELVLDKEYK